VTDLGTALGDLVEPEQPVTLGCAARLAQRNAPLRRVSIGEEDLHVRATR
jgi:hypothetical protein